MQQQYRRNSIMVPHFGEQLSRFISRALQALGMEMEGHKSVVKIQNYYVNSCACDSSHQGNIRVPY